MLATRLCSRLQIDGARRRLIMFLVDNHLTFWRTATTRNLDDPEVIAEFAGIVKTTVESRRVVSLHLRRFKRDLTG